MTTLIRDRIQLNSLFIVLCFLSVLLLTSQSAASYPSYFLAVSMLLTFSRWNDVFKERLALVLLVFIGYLCVSAFWSTPFEFGETGSIFARGLLVFCFVVALAECQLRGQVQRWLAKALAVSGVFVALAAFVIYFHSMPEDGRLNGLGQLDTHVVAALINATVSIFLLQIWLQERAVGWRLFALFGLVLCCAAVFFSDSRNAWVSLIFGSLIYVVAQLVTDRQRFMTAVVVVSLLLGLVFVVLLSDPAAREVVLPRGDSFRLDIWSLTLEKIRSTGLLFGLGITTPDSVVIAGETFQHPHNMFLAILFQGGLVGVSLFVVSIGFVLHALYAHYETQDAKLALGILAVALPSYLLDGHELIDKVGESWFLWWLPVGLALGLRWATPRASI